VYVFKKIKISVMKFQRIYIYTLIVTTHIIWCLTVFIIIVTSPSFKKPTLDELYSCSLQNMNKHHCPLKCFPSQLEKKPIEPRKRCVGCLGEMGKGVNLWHLTQEELKIQDNLESTYGFDIFMSDKISVRRALPDYRYEW